jgi:hypothetical protein
LKIKILILSLVIITSCDQVSKIDTSEPYPIKSNKDVVLDLKTNYSCIPLYPKVNQGYKFIGKMDSIHSVLVIKRINDSIIKFRTDNNSHNKKGYLKNGTAILNNKNGFIMEKSIVTNNLYKAYQFEQLIDSIKYEIRIGIDSIGSGKRLLVHFIVKKNNEIITDINMSN